MPNRAQEIFKPQFQFGMGGVSIGNEFNKHSDREAQETLEAAWAMRYVLAISLGLAVVAGVLIFASFAHH